MEKENRGRPKLSKKLKKVHCNFTVPPSVTQRLKPIREDRSPFIAAVLGAVPTSWIREYNRDRRKFVEKLAKSEMSLKPLGDALTEELGPSH